MSGTRIERFQLSIEVGRNSKEFPIPHLVNWIELTGVIIRPNGFEHVDYTRSVHGKVLLKGTRLFAKTMRVATVDDEVGTNILVDLPTPEQFVDGWIFGFRVDSARPPWDLAAVNTPCKPGYLLRRTAAWNF